MRQTLRRRLLSTTALARVMPRAMPRYVFRSVGETSADLVSASMFLKLQG